MTAKYFIKKIETCSACNGFGRVPHPAWEEYWKEWSKATLERRNHMDANQREWFESLGWYIGKTTMRTDGVPDEEVFCSECEGKGEITSEVELVEAIKDVIPS